MKKETKLTEREQLELQERRLDGEFDRRRLLRFGYLSVAERRRLRETYHDLDERFEPETDRFPLPLAKAFGIFIVYIIGVMIGAGNPENVTLIQWAIAIVLYWVIAGFQLRSWERIQGERNELYWSGAATGPTGTEGKFDSKVTEFFVPLASSRYSGNCTLPQKLSKQPPLCLGSFREKTMTIHSVAIAFRSAATRPVKPANGPTVYGRSHARLSSSL